MDSLKCAELLIAAAQETQAFPNYREQRQTDNYNPAPQEAPLEADDGPFNSDITANADPLVEDDGETSDISASNLAEALTLRKKDIEALREIAPLISISPRRAKRFLNIYLVIRARALGDPVLGEHLRSNGDLPESVPDNSLLALVALLLGLPKTMSAFIHDRQLSDASHTMEVGVWLSEEVQMVTVPGEKARLQTFLNSEPSITKLSVNAVIRWLPVARPYLPLGLEDFDD